MLRSIMYRVCIDYVNQLPFAFQYYGEYLWKAEEKQIFMSIASLGLWNRFGAISDEREIPSSLGNGRQIAFTANGPFRSWP